MSADRNRAPGNRPDRTAVNPGRLTALRVLSLIGRTGVRADSALREQMDRADLSPADAALCARMVRGVLQNRLLLDFYCGAYCSQKPSHLQTPLPDILRLGAYQVLFLDKVPPRAAVHQSVELARLSGRSRAAGLVNAVLRRVAENRDRLPELPGEDAPAESPERIRYLSLRYSHPVWLVERLVSLIGGAEAEAFLRQDNAPPGLTVRANPLRTDAAALLDAFRGAGLDAAPHPWGHGLLTVADAGETAALPGYREGAFFVQDAASNLAVRAAWPRRGQAVLDLCAAPGGKSFAAAAEMGGEGTILSCDISEGKLALLREGAARLGFSCITAARQDGTAFRSEWAARFDVVLADVPCSGLGVIRKKPDIRWKDPDSLQGLPALQSAILANAARYVRPGGTLVYSTCTVLPEENGAVTDAFLKAHPAFTDAPFPDGVEVLDGLHSPEGTGRPEAVGALGGVTLWPQRNGTDGFYFRVMRRKY